MLIFYVRWSVNNAESVARSVWRLVVVHDRTSREPFMGSGRHSAVFNKHGNALVTVEN
ncbi:MAG: hypothetical protein GXX96_01670 [Planctomycetaceae bacterium]|nr:hypothetical protein [Planctomycetaceae bacterium]